LPENNDAEQLVEVEMKKRRKGTRLRRVRVRTWKKLEAVGVGGVLGLDEQVPPGHLGGWRQRVESCFLSMRRTSSHRKVLC